MTNKERKRIDAEEDFQDRLYSGRLHPREAKLIFARDNFGSLRVAAHNSVHALRVHRGVVPLVVSENDKLWRKPNAKELGLFTGIVKGRIKTGKLLSKYAMPYEQTRASLSGIAGATRRHERKLAKTKTRATKSGGR